jgi:hypothetical protein
VEDIVRRFLRQRAVIEQELSSQYGLTAQFPDSSLDSLRRTPAEAKTLCALSGRSMGKHLFATATLIRFEA